MYKFIGCVSREGKITPRFTHGPSLGMDKKRRREERHRGRNVRQRKRFVRGEQGRKGKEYNEKKIGEERKHRGRKVR